MPQEVQTRALPGFDAETLARHITVHEALQVIEITFTGLTFTRSAEANAFYDAVEETIAQTGEPLWFFLVNSTDYRVHDEAWFAYSRRGRDMYEAHSMGTVHFDSSEVTRAQIERTRGTEAFDPTLFDNRAEALDYLRGLPSRRRERIVHEPSFERTSFMTRITFDHDARIMNVDFSGVSFEHSRDVNDIYNWLEERLRAEGGKWYFLINYDGTRIQSPAWVQFAARGKVLNEAFSLGSVRYAPGSETETDIRLRAESQGFRPNIRNTRAEALERIAEMKAEAAVG